ncbi:MAG: Uma2 family endonuclease [Rhodospirillales bacterium]|jgi:Uma2 family endonuclease
MSASLKPLTVNEFLAWERAQPLRFALDGIQPVAMFGDSTQHSRIQTRLVFALANRVAPPCEAHGSELKVVTATRVRYPDATVLYDESADGTGIVEPLPDIDSELPLNAIHRRSNTPNLG